MSDSASSPINRQTIRELARLAHLDLDPEEEVRYQKELAAIVEFVNQLERADVSDCQPLHQVTGVVNRLRNDNPFGLPPEQHPGPERLLPFLADRLIAGQFKSPRPPAGQAVADKE